MERDELGGRKWEQQRVRLIEQEGERVFLLGRRETISFPGWPWRRCADWGWCRFLDCIKVFSYNLQMKMCELLLNHYGKEKEILSALSMILNRGGHVKFQGGVLRVSLGSFKNPKIDYTARCLCEDLNSMNPRTLDAFQHPIHYEII